MNILSSSSDETVRQGVVDIQPSERRRPARFNVVESLQAKTFDHGESKESLSIIIQCLTFKNGCPQKNGYQMFDFQEAVEKLNMNNEFKSLSIALKREGIKREQRNQSEILVNKLDTLMNASPDEINHGLLCLYSMETFLYSQFNQFLREADEAKIETYGSFVRLLYFCFGHSSSSEVHSIEVYRGMNLISSMIDVYKKVAKTWYIISMGWF